MNGDFMMQTQQNGGQISEVTANAPAATQRCSDDSLRYMFGLTSWDISFGRPTELGEVYVLRMLPDGDWSNLLFHFDASPQERSQTQFYVRVTAGEDLESMTQTVFLIGSAGEIVKSACWKLRPGMSIPVEVNIDEAVLALSMWAPELAERGDTRRT